MSTVEEAEKAVEKFSGYVSSYHLFFILMLNSENRSLLCIESLFCVVDSVVFVIDVLQWYECLGIMEKKRMAGVSYWRGCVDYLN